MKRIYKSIALFLVMILMIGNATNDFVVVSTDGFIRTYFRPDSGKSYFDRQ